MLVITAFYRAAVERIDQSFRDDGQLAVTEGKVVSVIFLGAIVNL